MKNNDSKKGNSSRDFSIFLTMGSSLGEIQTNDGKLIKAKYEKSDQYSALAHVDLIKWLVRTNTSGNKAGRLTNKRKPATLFR